MRLLAKRVGIILLGPMLQSPAFAAPPYAFPDQPGVLSPVEIQDATEAMKPMLGGEPALPLVASGRRSPEHMLPGYALFAGPLADFSGRITFRRQIVCNFFRPMGKWQCSAPHDEFRMPANGLEHVFSHQVVQGTGNRQAAVDAAAFVYSECFLRQFEAMGGTPFTPSPDSDFVNTVLDDGKGFTVATGPLGDGNSYRLERAAGRPDGCGFRIHHVRLARSGAILPESYAKAAAEQSERERRTAVARQPAVPAQDRMPVQPPAAKEEMSGVEKVAGATFLGAMILCALVFVVPGFMRARGGQGAEIAGTLAVACTLAAVASSILVPEKYNIRVDLLINGVVVALAWYGYYRQAISASGNSEK